MLVNFSSKIKMCSYVESCLLRLILDSADSAMGVDKGGQEADTVRGSVEKRERKNLSKNEGHNSQKKWGSKLSKKGGG